MERSVSEKTQIKKMPTRRKKAAESLPKEKLEDLEGLLDAIEAA
jgi:hypothetical protein